jgi:hypothetical protein
MRLNMFGRVNRLARLYYVFSWIYRLNFFFLKIKPIICKDQNHCTSNIDDAICLN